ncbi:MAG: hypothetical protein HRT89_22470 [Lentisphaeria bacterium]|nr:hypothetical protein [Lentisphaeria bacterium]NQZ70824.1 hypothetical protein [Lentisphaeria bacterium]
MNYKESFISTIEELTGEPITEADGMEDSLIERAPVAIPLSMKAYYSVCGNHQINTEHNRLLSPEQTYREGDHLVFAEENQNVVIWGILLNEQQDDPIVFQGQENEEKITWYSEEMTFSNFLLGMWKWQRGNE